MKRTYIFSADVIRVLAIIGVVVVHTVNAIHARPDFAGGTTWWVANFFESLSRVSVPLFVMLSGYFLLNKKEHFQKTLSRIFFRIGIPYLFWLALYLVWSSGRIEAFDLGAYVTLLWSGGAFHLYFLVILIGLYFISPVLRKYFVPLGDLFQRHVTLAFFLLGIVIVGAQYLFGACSLENSFTRWIPFVGYFAAGYTLGKKSSLPPIVLLGLFGLGLAVTMYFNYFHLLLVRDSVGSMQVAGCISPYFDNYLSPSVVVMTLSLFALLFHRTFLSLLKLPVVPSLIKSIARASFGIYLVHILFVELIEVRLGVTIDTYPFFLLSFFLVRFVGIFVVSYLISLVLCRIPVARWVVGER